MTKADLTFAPATADADQAVLCEFDRTGRAPSIGCARLASPPALYLSESEKENKVKNYDKFKTVDEREQAFMEYCTSLNCMKCIDVDPSKRVRCILEWLEAEADDDLLACPFCGGSCRVYKGYDVYANDVYFVKCNNNKECCYSSGIAHRIDHAIKWHNRVTRAVMEHKSNGIGTAGKGEAK